MELQKKLSIVREAITLKFMSSEPEFLNLLGSPGIDSQPGGRVRQPYLSYRPAKPHWMAESIPRNPYSSELIQRLHKLYNLLTSIISTQRASSSPYIPPPLSISPLLAVTRKYFQHLSQWWSIFLHSWELPGLRIKIICYNLFCNKQERLALSLSFT